MPVEPQTIRRERSRGSTLIELIITMAIVAIVAAIAVPRFARAQDSACVDAASRRLVAELGAVRQRAIVSRTTAEVSFSSGTGKVRISGIDVASSSFADGGFDLALSPYGVVVASTTIPSETLTFDGYGYSKTPGKISLQRGSVASTVTITTMGAISWKR